MIFQCQVKRRANPLVHYAPHDLRHLDGVFVRAHVYPIQEPTHTLHKSQARRNWHAVVMRAGKLMRQRRDILALRHAASLLYNDRRYTKKSPEL